MLDKTGGIAIDSFVHLLFSYAYREVEGVSFRRLCTMQYDANIQYGTRIQTSSRVQCGTVPYVWSHEINAYGIAGISELSPIDLRYTMRCTPQQSTTRKYKYVVRNVSTT